MAYQVLHEHCHFGVSAPSPSISHMAFHLVAGSVTWISSRISPKNIHGCWTTKWATYLTKWLWKGFGWLGELYQPKMTTSPRPFGNLPKDLQMPGTQGHVHPRTERYWKISNLWTKSSSATAPIAPNSSKQKKPSDHRISCKTFSVSSKTRNSWSSGFREPPRLSKMKRKRSKSPSHPQSMAQWREIYTVSNFWVIQMIQRSEKCSEKLK